MDIVKVFFSTEMHLGLDQLKQANQGERGLEAIGSWHDIRPFVVGSNANFKVISNPSDATAVEGDQS